jgi:cytidylate kinase
LLDAYREAGGDEGALARFDVAARVVPVAWAIGAAPLRDTGLAPPGARKRAGAVVLAVDGQAGTGKTPLAAALARELGVAHLSRGAVFRAAVLAQLVRQSRIGARALRRAPRISEVARAGTRAPHISGAMIRAVDGGGVELRGKRVPEAALRVSAVEKRVAAVANDDDAIRALSACIDVRRGAVVEGRDVAHTLAVDAAVFIESAPLVARDSARVARDAARVRPSANAIVVSVNDLDEIPAIAARIRAKLVEMGVVTT